MPRGQAGWIQRSKVFRTSIQKNDRLNTFTIQNHVLYVQFRNLKLVLVSCSDPYSYTPPESSGPGIPRPTILIEPHDVTVNGKNIVRINSTVDDGIIYYTTNGSTPSILSSTRYYSDVGIPVEDTVTIKAIVAKDGKKSPVATRVFYKLKDEPRLLVHWNSLEINSSYPYVYYVENSIENDPAKMNQYDEVIVP